MDGEIVHEAGDVSVTKIAIDPVWWLPGVAERFGVAEGSLAAACSSRPAECIPSSSPAPISRVFLPPIGGMTLYIFGDPAFLGDTAEDPDLPGP